MGDLPRSTLTRQKHFPRVNDTAANSALIEFFTLNWGYDSNTIVPMPYDWRLSPDVLEERDGFFSHIKVKIEQAVAHNKVRKGPASVMFCGRPNASS